MKTPFKMLPILLVMCCTSLAGSPDSPSGGGTNSSGKQTLAGPHGKYVPTPAMAVAFHIDKDSREWKMQFLDGDRNGIICEFVIKGDSIEQWKEMAAQQIAFTKVSLRKYVDGWKDMLSKADAKVDVKEETLTDGSIFVTYTSPSADETSMRRFIKGKDGVYMLAYHVRPKLKKDETFKIWDDIIRTANLIPNPEKKR
jgi:hypothetical protein